MNTEKINQEVVQSILDEEESVRNFRPRLTFYHANGKGTGSAAQFEVVPACGTRDGVIYMTLASQKSVAGLDDQGKRTYAGFDWQNRVIVKLNFSDLCQMLLVLRGLSASIADGKGLYHDSRNMTTIINLNRQTEPFAGVVLDVSRKAKEGGDEPVRVRIVLKDAEVYGLGTVLEQSLGVIAFGVPRESRPFSVPARPESELPAI